jgi:hypothetical protein
MWNVSFINVRARKRLLLGYPGNNIRRNAPRRMLFVVAVYTLGRSSTEFGIKLVLEHLLQLGHDGLDLLVFERVLSILQDE